MQKSALTILISILFAANPGQIYAEAPSKDQIKEVLVEVIKENPELIKEALIEQRKRDEDKAVSKQASILKDSEKVLYNGQFDYRMGNPNGDVKIVVLHDLRCSHCKAAHFTLLDYLKEEKNVTAVMKDFPIMGKDSKVAARACLAAFKQGVDKQGKFVEQLISFTEPATEKDIFDIATKCGLNIDQLKKDMDQKEIRTSIEETKGMALKLGVSGTPTFIIGKPGKEKVYPGELQKDEIATYVAEARKA